MLEESEMLALNHLTLDSDVHYTLRRKKFF